MDIIAKLREQEPKAIIQTLAFMSYNPSIGRVLKSGGVKKFMQISVDEIKKTKTIKSKKDFDKFHKRFVKKLLSKLRTNKGRKLSYGQAQKPVNTFLKVYIDWANLPDQKTAARLRRFLHCPLDSILMQAVRDEFREKYEKRILPTCRRKYIQPSNSSLTCIDEELYGVWQEMLKLVYPEKPVLLDVFWALNR